MMALPIQCMFQEKLTNFESQAGVLTKRILGRKQAESRPEEGQDEPLLGCHGHWSSAVGG